MKPQNKTSEELYSEADSLKESAQKYLKTGVGAGVAEVTLRYDEELLELAGYTNELPELYSSSGPVAQTILGGIALAGVGIGSFNLLESRRREDQAADRENTEMIVEALEPEDGERR